MATQGALIRAIDYNTIQTSVANILGGGSASFGYGQTVTSSQVLPTPSNPTGTQVVEANDWAKLKIDILKIANHQGTASNPLVTAVPSITANTEIDNDQITAFENVVPFLNSNRFLLAEFSDESFTPDISQIRTTAWGASSKPTVRHSFTVDFGSADAARHFFNSGSSLRFSASFVGNFPTSQNQAWANLLSQMGTVVYNHGGATASSGTGSAIGFYQLTNVAQQVFTKTGLGSYTPAYAANDYTITMSCDVTNNSTGTARYIYVSVYFNDDHTGFSDTVNGTLRHNVSVRRAAGSNVNVTKPAATNTVLLTA